MNSSAAKEKARVMFEKGALFFECTAFLKLLWLSDFDLKMYVKSFDEVF